MADVLESQYAMLLKKIDTSTNFEELRLAHDVFLTSVMAHTFINNKPVIFAETYENDSLMKSRLNHSLTVSVRHSLKNQSLNVL